MDDKNLNLTMTKYMQVSLIAVPTFLGLALIQKLFSLPNLLIPLLIALFLLLFIYLTSYAVRSMPAQDGVTSKSIELLSYVIFVGLLFGAITGIHTRGDFVTVIYVFFVIVFLLHFHQKAKDDLRWKNLHIRTALLFVVSIILTALIYPVNSQQPNIFYDPQITNPFFRQGAGPKIVLDEGHNNFHKLDGLYAGFGNVLKDDGYQIESTNEAFSSNLLEQYEVLVISNAIHESNRTNWINPTRSAFTREEIEVVRKWVEQGGSIFLIADHMPFAGAAADMAAAFGFQFKNGFAMDTIDRDDVFSLEDSTLIQSNLTKGKSDKSVRNVISFTGQAFPLPSDAQPITVFGEPYIQWEPDTAWKLNSVKPYPVAGFAQVAAKNYGQGRVVVSGEAMMFTSQLFFGFSWMPLGMKVKENTDNQLLLRNIMLYLTKEIDL